MYRLNEKADILDANTIKSLNACSEMLQKAYPDVQAELILFGSQARGQADPESDVDLLVLIEEGISSERKKAVHDSIYEISLAYDVVISAIILTKLQWNSPISAVLPLYQNVIREGIRVA